MPAAPPDTYRRRNKKLPPAAAPPQANFSAIPMENAEFRRREGCRWLQYFFLLRYHTSTSGKSAHGSPEKSDQRSRRGLEQRLFARSFSHISDVGFETVVRARCEELPWEIRAPETEIRRPEKKEKKKRNVPWGRRPRGENWRQMWVAR